MKLIYKRDHKNDNYYYISGFNRYYLFNNDDLPTGTITEKHDGFLYYLGIRFSELLRNHPAGIRINTLKWR